MKSLRIRLFVWALLMLRSVADFTNTTERFGQGRFDQWTQTRLGVVNLEIDLESGDRYLLLYTAGCEVPWGLIYEDGDVRFQVGR